jgi:hypothetical protein
VSGSATPEERLVPEEEGVEKVRNDGSVWASGSIANEGVGGARTGVATPEERLVPEEEGVEKVMDEAVGVAKLEVRE